LAPLPVGAWKPLGPAPLGPPYLASGGTFGGPNSGRVTADLVIRAAVSRVAHTNGALVAATDQGVYGTPTPSGSPTVWSVVGTGLPVVQVQDVFVDPSTRDLYDDPRLEWL
jgi:hypothetical protein